MLVVDTNILVYAADVRSPFHSSCRGWIEQQQQRSEAWYTTWPILYEFLRVATHPLVMRRPWNANTAWKFVASLLASPGLSVLEATDRHAEVAAHFIEEFPRLVGNIFHDAHTAILMREHGLRRVCTHDAHFHRFSFLEVIDPV